MHTADRYKSPPFRLYAWQWGIRSPCVRRTSLFSPSSLSRRDVCGGVVGAECCPFTARRRDPCCHAKPSAMKSAGRGGGRRQPLDSASARSASGAHGHMCLGASLLSTFFGRFLAKVALCPCQRPCGTEGDRNATVVGKARLAGWCVGIYGEGKLGGELTVSTAAPPFPSSRVPNSTCPTPILAIIFAGEEEGALSGSQSSLRDKRGGFMHRRKRLAGCPVCSGHPPSYRTGVLPILGYKGIFVLNKLKGQIKVKVKVKL